MSSAPITALPKIGPVRAAAFARMGLFSVDDLVSLPPRTYIDYSNISQIEALEHGTRACIRVTVDTPVKTARIRRGFTISSAKVHDATGSLRLTWYNQPFRSVCEGDTVYACGVYDDKKGKKLLNPSIYDTLPGIVPVYPLTTGVTQRLISEAIRAALDMIDEPIDLLPQWMHDEYCLLPRAAALRSMHFPSSITDASDARRRFSFEEAVQFMLMLHQLRSDSASRSGMRFDTDGLKKGFEALLPFPLTMAQSRAIDEISSDLSKDVPMNRLLQGDVGSGKTAIALFMMYAAAKNGCQSALMAPTEILAAQHYESVKAVFGERAVLVRGAMKPSERAAALDSIASGDAVAVVGTHALIQSGVVFSRLGAVIADEQHRFGVRQRAELMSKNAEPGQSPHMLIMSATPIPRTLSLMLFGDLDISVLDELPPGRSPVKTKLVPVGKRKAMYDFIESRVACGEQAYVVCPLVEPSEEMPDVASAEELFIELQGLLHVRMGLLHGRMSAAEKDAVALSFKNGDTDVLVATTVVEVGVDVKNATVMAIENAERFGLATLHQLRGRVGRSDKESWCFLLSASGGESSNERLSIMTSTTDGFVIAEKDLAMRGPGEFLGQRQHGSELAGMLSVLSDMQLLHDAQKAANEVLTKRDGAEALISEAKRKLERISGIIAPN